MGGTVYHYSKVDVIHNTQIGHLAFCSPRLLCGSPYHKKFTIYFIHYFKKGCSCKHRHSAAQVMSAPVPDLRQCVRLDQDCNAGFP